MREGVLDYIEQGEEVDIKVLLHVFDICVCEARKGLQDTSAEDEGRKRAEAGEGEVDGGLVVRVIGHVAVEDSELVWVFGGQGIEFWGCRARESDDVCTELFQKSRNSRVSEPCSVREHGIKHHWRRQITSRSTGNDHGGSHGDQRLPGQKKTGSSLVSSLAPPQPHTDSECVCDCQA
jgi:hypothetical protein